MKLIAALGILLLSLTQSVLADEMSPYTGNWTVSVDKTLENSKNSPKYKKEQEEDFKQALTSMMNAMRLEVTTNKVIFHLGESKEIIPLGTITATPPSVVAKISADNKEATLTFTPYQKNYINVKSSVSHDLDYIIWEKTTKASDTKKLDVITNAIQDSAAANKKAEAK
ncbi:hypothetical protein GCM10011613_31700 [Cellvibrio zantedeschiae]|uniref:DUF4468 domain-containing protein n=1 Tax=Cellvibrio zantedeschiae TaxID=1237077 RepID=A0ABQ3BCJ6_9GAMM|nr:hypothetical protein [Cellvibrio zantedeschiae]GGY84432.1 hypothetical protein GCM10011613_31700 [Cellvibrio zantedeschiae]